MLTANSETTRTDRSGCLERTLDATNCTQMLSDIRCDILTNNVKNSSMPDGSTAWTLSCPPLPSPDFSLLGSLPETDRARMMSMHCLRKASTVEGSAASNTETASTIAMSSSSVRWASCAASSSSCAIPSETENARSEPSDPSAPVVAIQPTLLKATEPASSYDPMKHSATTSEIRSTSSECCCLRPALACQQDLSLPIRHLLISPLLETKNQGRGGKAMRERIGSTHRHWYSSSIFGCLIGSALDFVRQPDQRVVDVMRILCECLKQSGNDIMSCYGADAVHIQRGFACHHVIRAQLMCLSESKTCSRLDSKYGKKSVALGISACMYFVLHALAKYDDNSSSVSFIAVPWMKQSLQLLGMWKCRAQATGPYQCSSLEAERRAVERGLVAFEMALADSKSKELLTKDAVVYQLSCMRKAMWPSGRRLDADTQDEMLAWIKSEEFKLDNPIRHIPRSYISDSFNRPLSAIACLPGSRMGGDSDDASVCDSASSIGSFSSVSSTGSVVDRGDLGFDMSMSLGTTLQGVSQGVRS